MSRYTTELRFICESYAGKKESVGFDSIESIINTAAPKIFSFDFPIFDENYRKPLEHRFLKHFYTREICEETVGLWKLRLEDRLNLIMPYYNQLYKSALLDFNPFYDVDLTRDHTTDFDSNSNLVEKVGVENIGTSENTNISSGVDWDLYSDTPQGGVDGIEAINDNLYLTNARKNTSNNTTTDSGETTEKTDTDRTAENTLKNLEEYIEHVKGKQGTASYSKMLQEFRATFLNIDNMLMEELSTLFFGLW